MSHLVFVVSSLSFFCLAGFLWDCRQVNGTRRSGAIPYTIFSRKVKWKLNWFGLDLFNGKSHPARHISYPTRAEVSHRCCGQNTKSDGIVRFWGLIQVQDCIRCDWIQIGKGIGCLISHARNRNPVSLRNSTTQVLSHGFDVTLNMWSMVHGA